MNKKKGVRDSFLYGNPQVNLLPGDDFIHYLLLFQSAFPEVNPGGFYAFVSHQVCKEGYIIVFIKKIFGKTVSERMGIYDLGIESIFDRIVL